MFAVEYPFRLIWLQGKQALLSLGIVLTILGVSPLISLISVSFLQLGLHFICLPALFFLTGKNPKMGNPGLYTFSYLYLVGTVHYQSFQQLEQTFFVLVFAYLLLAFVYHVKHKKLDQEITFIQMVTENGFFNQRNIWFGYYALGISLLLFIGTHLQIDRFMWATFASSSLFSGYNTFKLSERAKERIIGVVIGSLVSAILLFYIPTNLLGILGGLCLGLCTSYKSKTIFNCVGAIMAAFYDIWARNKSLLKNFVKYVGASLRFALSFCLCKNYVLLQSQAVAEIF